MVCESLHLLLDRLQCKVSAPEKLRCSAKTTLVLYHLFDGARGLIKTDDETWNTLMNFRHDASHLRSLHLKTEKSFWDIARWRDGAQEVLDQTSLRNISSDMEFPNFLAKVAKIAAPAPRWVDLSLQNRGYDASEDPNCRIQGTVLQITIDGTDSGEQQKFVRELEDAINVLRTARPFFHWNGQLYTRTEEERKRRKARARYRNDSRF